jgi:hypothetical protein
MTQDEIKADVDNAIEEFAQLVLSADAETSGVPKPPEIEVVETTLEGSGFDFEVTEPPTAQVLEGGGIIIGYPHTGACCFSSGDCFIETESECGTDGGEYQGNDTDCVPNPCVFGACCDALGTCYSRTSAGCTAIGGTYQGDGTDCDPNPCTGACCVGGSCSIETVDDCSGMGGTYQGNGTTCDPNPCNTCACYFDAYDGSGRAFLTETETYTWTRAHESGPCNIDGSYSRETSSTFDPVTCDTTDSDECSGGCHLVCSGFCERGCNVDTDCRCVTDEGCLGGCDPGCSIDFVGCFFDCSEEVVTATSKITTCTMIGSIEGRTCGGSSTHSFILSDECTPT